MPAISKLITPTNDPYGFEVQNKIQARTSNVGESEANWLVSCPDNEYINAVQNRTAIEYVNYSKERYGGIIGFGNSYKWSGTSAEEIIDKMFISRQRVLDGFVVGHKQVCDELPVDYLGIFDELPGTSFKNFNKLKPKTISNISKFRNINNDLNFLNKITKTNALNFLENTEPELVNPLIGYINIIENYMSNSQFRYTLNVILHDDPEDENFKILVIVINAKIDNIDREMEMIDEIGELLDIEVSKYKENNKEIFDKLSFITYILEDLN